MALDAARCFAENYVKFYSGAYEIFKSGFEFVAEKVSEIGLSKLLDILSRVFFLEALYKRFSGAKPRDTTRTYVILGMGTVLMLFSYGLLHTGPAGCKFSSSNPAMCESMYLAALVATFVGGSFFLYKGYAAITKE